MGSENGVDFPSLQYEFGNFDQYGAPTEIRIKPVMLNTTPFKNLHHTL